VRKRRTFVYDARSTSTEKVESGATRGERKGFSLIGSYPSVFALSGHARG
jgi:hypothetical protein